MPLDSLKLPGKSQNDIALIKRSPNWGYDEARRSKSRRQRSLPNQPRETESQHLVLPRDVEKLLAVIGVECSFGLSTEPRCFPPITVDAMLPTLHSRALPRPARKLRR